MHVDRMRGAILGLVFLLVPAMRAQDDFLADAGEIGSCLEAIVPRALEQERIPGAAVVVVQWGEVVFAKGWGVADVATSRPVDPAKTVFRIGSISKAVTGVALSRLVDEKKIGLDDDVNTHLVDLKVDARFAEPVRVRHLFTHTAGFDQRGIGRNFFDVADPGLATLRAMQPDAEAAQIPDRRNRPSLREFLGRELVRIRPPGLVPCYDTYGATLAGYLVESIAKKPYREAMAQLVFEPLGMKTTWIEMPESRRGELATGYASRDGRLAPLPYEYYATLPASSVDATPLDMAQLMIALLGDGKSSHGRLMSEAGAKRTLARQFFPREEFPGFTHLFFEELRRGRRLVEHGGTMMGYSCKLFMAPEDQLGVFIACNRDSETGPPVQLHEAVTRALLDAWLPPQEPEGAFVVPEPLPIDTERFAGEWAGVVHCHECEPGVGWGRSTHAMKSIGPGRLGIGLHRYVAIEPLLFVREDGRVRMLFVEDAKGAITYRYDSDYAAAVYEKVEPAPPPAPAER